MQTQISSSARVKTLQTQLAQTLHLARPFMACEDFPVKALWLVSLRWRYTLRHVFIFQCSHQPALLQTLFLLLFKQNISHTFAFSLPQRSFLLSIKFISSVSPPFSHRWRWKGTEGLTANRWFFVEGAMIKEAERGVADKGHWPTPQCWPATTKYDYNHC